MMFENFDSPFYNEYLFYTPRLFSIYSFERDRDRERERERERENESGKIKEIESNNEYFTNENNIKYNLYPLYINWKKIESKSLNNSYYNVFKLFGYFGEAIFNIIKEANDEDKDLIYQTKPTIIELMMKIKIFSIIGIFCLN